MEHGGSERLRHIQAFQLRGDVCLRIGAAFLQEEDAGPNQQQVPAESKSDGFDKFDEVWVRLVYPEEAKIETPARNI